MSFKRSSGPKPPSQFFHSPLSRMHLILSFKRIYSQLDSVKFGTSSNSTYRTAQGHPGVLCSLYTVSQQANAICTIFFRSTVVQFPKVNPKLRRTLLHQPPLWNRIKLLLHTHGKAYPLLRVVVQIFGTKLQDVAQTLRRTMLALHPIIMIRRLPDV